MSNKILTMDNYIDENPFLKDICQVYTTLTELAKLTVKPLEMLSDEEIQKCVADGLPVFQQKEYQERLLDVLFKQFSSFLQGILELPVTEAMKKSAEQLLKKMVSDGFKKELLRLTVAQENEKLQEFCAKDNIDAGMVRIFVWLLVAEAVPSELKKGDYWTEKKWRCNYCPSCGRQPVLAQLKKEANGKARFLKCDGCHTKWPYDRTGCVYCGNQDLEAIKILEPEGSSDIRLYACNKCKSYLKTYINEEAENIFLKDWATVHFDLLGEENGYAKKGAVVIG